MDFVLLSDWIERVESRRVGSSRVESSIAGAASPQLALVLRRLGEGSE